MKTRQIQSAVTDPRTGRFVKVVATFTVTTDECYDDDEFADLKHDVVGISNDLEDACASIARRSGIGIATHLGADEAIEGTVPYVSNAPVECVRCLNVVGHGPAPVACRACGSKFTPTLLELATKHEHGGIDCGACKALDHASECRSLSAAETGSGREAQLDSDYHREHG